MEKIKSIVQELNPEIDLDEFTDEECHILYHYFTKSELNNISAKDLKNSTKIFKKVIDDIEPIIQRNKQTIYDDGNGAEASGEPGSKAAENAKPSDNPSSGDNASDHKEKIIKKIKNGNAILRKWIIEELIKQGSQIFSKEQLAEQNASLEKLLAKRKKDINFFNQYLKQGKKTPELLKASYFSGFNQEVHGLLSKLTNLKPVDVNDFFSSYYYLKGAESSKLEELTFIRMLYDTTTDEALKKILYQAYTKFPEPNLASIKQNVIKNIL